MQPSGTSAQPPTQLTEPVWLGINLRIGLAIAVSNAATPFGVLLLIAAFAGFGGGNFAS